MTLPSQNSSSPAAVRSQGGAGASRSLKVSPRGAVGAVGVALVIAFVAWGLSQLLPKSAPEGGAKDTQVAGLGVLPTDTADTTRPTPVDLTNPAVAAPGTTPASGTEPAMVQPNNNPAAPAFIAQPALGATPATQPPTPTVSVVTTLTAEGEQALRDGKAVLAREKLSKALLSPLTTEAEQATLRDKLTSISADLLFSQKVTPGDLLVEEYTVQGGDSYERIRKRQQLAVDWRLLERINRTPPNRIRVGQKLKLINGPFHVVVDKSDYRLDVFSGSPDDQASWVYIRSFNVGLGENDTTPIGTFKVKIGGKAIAPNWTNPRTGEQFDGKDPKNPIGNRWIGIEGLGAASSFTSYGLHGTIEPDSIGQQRSMGCVRLVNTDVELVYELMCEDISVVKIQQ
jgi:L,D-transpeptidase catalytic domain/LysM domain